MKVRRNHTVGGTEWVVVEDSPTFYIGHIEVGDGCPVELKLLRKSEYEPIPTETWRDVTSDCDYTEAGWQISKSNNGYFNWPCIPDGYRLRKVHFHEMTGNDYAFKVEKRDAYRDVR